MAKINPKYVCICDRERPELAAMIVSYLAAKGSYFPLFEFPFVFASYREAGPDAIDEESMSIHRAEGAAITINNAIARMGGCELLIIAGLSDNQKSFLGNLTKRNHISINTAEEIDFYLSPHTDKTEKFICRSSDMMAGLFAALQSNKLLNIDETAEEVRLDLYRSDRLILAEDDHSSASLSAALYAFASGSDLMVVPAISPAELQQVFESIRARNTSAMTYAALEDMIRVRVKDNKFEKYNCATFFTIGLPYSLILKNIIPFSHVLLHARADIFVANSLLWEEKEKFGSGIVFSPGVFKNDETGSVIKQLEDHGYYVKKMFDREASVYNLQNTLKEFPFDLLHICSHGGEIKGTRLRLKFKDEKDNEHTVEYESVLSISPIPGSDKFLVQEKWFPRLLDGMIWGSKEVVDNVDLQPVKELMHKAIHDALAKDKEVMERDVVVTNSVSIHCNDGNYQAMMQLIASQTSPIIFNNTCWSWYHIAQEFLNAGARGYIGTLWNVNNKDAVNFASSFYNKVFSGTILNAFYSAFNDIKGTESENVYIYWGLPFTTVQPTDLKKARHNVMAQMLDAHFRYDKNMERTNDEEIKESIKPIQDWIQREIESNFKDEFVADVERKRNLLEEMKKKGQ